MLAIEFGIERCGLREGSQAQLAAGTRSAPRFVNFRSHFGCASRGPYRINQKTHEGRTCRRAGLEKSRLALTPRSAPGSTRDRTDSPPTTLRTAAPVPRSPALFDASRKAAQRPPSPVLPAPSAARRAARRTGTAARTGWDPDRRPAVPPRCHAAALDRSVEAERAWDDRRAPAGERGPTLPRTATAVPARSKSSRARHPRPRRLAAPPPGPP